MTISVFRDEIISFPPSGLTLDWYVNAWARREFARGFVTSLQVAALATCIGVPLGTAAAYALVRGGLRGASVMSTLLLAPLAVPAVVAGTALYMFYLRAEFWLDRDIAATLESLVAAHVLLTIPWTVRLVTASLQGLDRAAEEAAANLGARPLTVFRRVTLPAMRSGIIAACLPGVPRGPDARRRGHGADPARRRAHARHRPFRLHREDRMTPLAEAT
jgi:putative spermidine/putrescine transport system permease protein